MSDPLLITLTEHVVTLEQKMGDISREMSGMRECIRQNNELIESLLPIKAHE